MPTLDEMTGQYHVSGGSGVRLAVRVAGPADAPPVVLLHGWAQSSRVWRQQLTGPLADTHRVFAPDLRGHGGSAAPAAGYDSGAEWAADVRAVLALAGSPAVLVGWSYGGLVITDYLREHGTTGLAGIAFVGAITEIGRGRAGGRVGPVMRAALPDALSADPAVSEPALRAFATGMIDADRRHVRPTPLAEELLATTLKVRPDVRAAAFARDVGSVDVLAAIDVPTLVLHGRRDGVVDPAAAEFTAATVPDSQLTWFDNVGHLPFLEKPAEFDAALAAHLDRCFAPLGGTR